MRSLKRPLSQILSLAVLTLGLNSPLVMAEQFSLVTENFPPLNMSTNGKSVARNNQVTGLATDIVRKLMNNTGYSATYRMKRSWDRAFDMAAETSGYGVYSAFRTPEREDMFKWVGPLYSEEWVLYANEGWDGELSSLEDAKDLRMGTFEQDGIGDYLRDEGFSPILSNSDAANAARLKNGSIDVWATSSLSGPYTASNFNLPVKNVLTFHRSYLWLAMNKETDDAAIKTMNDELQRMHERGDIETILAQYR